MNENIAPGHNVQQFSNSQGQVDAQPAQQAFPVPYTQPVAVMAPSAPFGTHPVSGQPLSDKSKTALILLSFFLGGLGADRFYKGDVALGFLKFFTLGGLGLWALIDFIMFLAGKPTDKYGRLID